jgi:Lon protease-like protein
MEGVQMSDTPRTETYVLNPLPQIVSAEWARQLERELNAANERIKRLEEWKDSAMAVEREWDANALSTMLGGKPGESQRVVIMREVPRLLERIKRLEEVGDEMYRWITVKRLCSIDCTEAWNKAKEAMP